MNRNERRARAKQQRSHRRGAAPASLETAVAHHRSGRAEQAEFDRFADNFDNSLERLDYRAPARPETFDVVVSGNTLVYFGDLAPPVAACREALRPGAFWRSLSNVQRPVHGLLAVAISV